MSPLIAAIAVTILSLAGMGAAFLVFKKGGAGNKREEYEKTIAEISSTNAEIQELIKSKDSFIGPKQFEHINTHLTELNSEVEKERGSLKQIEEKLDGAQKLVEAKEAQQQEIKGAKEEDLVKLQELLVSFDDISQESIALEQRLALSLKSLDGILNELELTQTQRDMFTQLQSAVEEGGARMRDLLMEYQTVNERLNMLRQQHSDLEEEYTRLVEQQLGE